MAIYHLRASVGSRTGGQSGGAKADYISRGGKYSRGGDEVAHLESLNMPEWAKVGRSDRTRDAGCAYWRSADQNERANGVLFKELVVALPRELDRDQQIALTRQFALHLSTHGVEGGALPATFAIHDNGKGNPHAHLMISPRVNDGCTRDAATWFKRAASSTKGKPVDPAKGGARKTDALNGKDWLAEARADWASRANAALAQSKTPARVDHRSLKDQGIARPPTRHVGPAGKAIERKGLPSTRVAQAKPAESAARSHRANVELRRNVQREETDARDDAEYLGAQIDATRRRIAAIERRAGAKKTAAPAPAPAPRPTKPRAGKNAALNPERSEWKQNRLDMLKQWYGRVNATFARYWSKVTRTDLGGGKTRIEYENRSGRLVDTGPVIALGSGNIHEIKGMAQLAQMKGWTTISFTGSPEFKREAMREARAAGLFVLPRSAEDQQILREVSPSLVRGTGVQHLKPK